MTDNLPNDSWGEDYRRWLAELKQRVERARLRAVTSANRELVTLYWQIGREILDRQQRQGWGAGVVDQLARDLKAAFPDMRGFSPRNLKYMRSLAQAWPGAEFVQQPAAQLPWFHLCTLLDKVKDPEQRSWYAGKTLEHGWSRQVLTMQIETAAYTRAGSAVTNFRETLPPQQSDLARDALKDPYIFDFLGLTEDAQERDIEQALTRHITRFLLELGAGFAFVGRQYRLDVGGDEFFIDLLFYHLKLRCYVVVELKTTPFRPEYAGQLNFYLSAIDAQVKAQDDQPTIGLLLCKEKNRLVAEYALRGVAKPMGVAEYQLLRQVPESLETELPSIDQIEAELRPDLPDH
ncbi:PDDEXK nuclease domain-containing protein [Paraburkholderia nemoris]|jgi:predicted nuclease of restriction endonuclease-like (RecB) superfamily|uniref:PDDEXK nuclease domain-containing protein n=1 Tax=Paraburkholderia nemoris TaxID=2793076 RepID=UPI001B18B345|nr:PDDEXK nuclease domain-containing protein [Paraburkholderia nemoris]CAE6804616.1 Putative nuclease YhcG [Paraburkholderia nemoris]